MEHLHRFLHSVKGSAATFGMDKISAIAETLLDGLPEEDINSVWPKEKLEFYIQELIHTHHELYQEITQGASESAATLQSVMPNLKSIGFEPTILLIDDDYSQLIFLKEIMELQGWTVIATLDSEKAISFIMTITLIV